MFEFVYTVDQPVLSAKYWSKEVSAQFERDVFLKVKQGQEQDWEPHSGRWEGMCSRLGQQEFEKEGDWLFKCATSPMA